MEIKECSNLNEFYSIINPLLEQEKWANVTVQELEELVQLNLRLFVEQTEKKGIAQDLQNKLRQLSDRINQNFNNAAAHNLAFALEGIAQGIFSISTTKVDFNKSQIPIEIKQKILAELTPKGEEVRDKNIIQSQLKDPGLVGKQLQAAAKGVKKAWVDEENVSLRTYGCKTASDAIDYIINNNLSSANLLDFPYITDDELIRLLDARQNLKHLFIKSKKISDKALEHCKGMSLSSAHFYYSDNITDKGLENFKNMKLKSIVFKCENITDKGLENFKRMPLENVVFNGCENITDEGLANFKDMKLKSVDFSYCDNITDEGLENFKAMPLENVVFAECSGITDDGLENFKDMKLKSVDFSYCDNITDDGLENFKGMPLKNIAFDGCMGITEGGLRELIKQVPPAAP